LDEVSLKARCAKLLFAEQPSEKAPVVASFLEFDEIRAFEGRPLKLHLLSSDVEEWPPAQIGAEAAGRHVTLERLEPHMGRGSEVPCRTPWPFAQARAVTTASATPLASTG